MSKYLNPVCRGALELGSNCGVCERCLDNKNLEGKNTDSKNVNLDLLILGAIDTINNNSFTSDKSKICFSLNYQGAEITITVGKSK